jgi:hypothetical protein
VSARQTLEREEKKQDRQDTRQNRIGRIGRIASRQDRIVRKKIWAKLREKIKKIFYPIYLPYPAYPAAKRSYLSCFVPYLAYLVSPKNYSADKGFCRLNLEYFAFNKEVLGYVWNIRLCRLKKCD